MPSAALTELFQEHVVAAMIRQARLREAVGDGAEGWAADVPGGWLQLGSREFAAELVGSASDEGGTFLWAWANPAFDAGTPASLAVRALGEERGIAELVDDFEVPLDRLDAFTAAVLAVGVGGLDAYYLAPLEDGGGGVLVLGIRDDGLRVGPPGGAALASTLTNLLSAAPPFGHRRAFAHYLARPLPGADAEIAGGRVVLRAADGAVVVSFDREGRVAEIRAELRPAGGG